MRSRSVRRRPWLVRSVATLLACLAVGPGRAAWAQCEQWIHGGGSGPTGLGTTEAVVASMTTWDPDADGPEPARLVVAGARQLLPDIAFPNSSVLTWDGARWQSLGLFVASSDLVNGPAVNALIVHNGALVAGGAFFINGAPVNIARWTGSQWEALGGGITGTVRDLAIHNGDLVAGGLFTAAGGLPVSNLARWDGSAWHDLGGGTNQEVRALEVLGPDLVLAGSFTAAGGAPAQHVARWDGSAFAPLGGGLVPPVWSLGTYAGTLVAGEYGGTVRRWDGAQWLVLGGLSGHFQALLELDGALYAAGGLPWTVARWDGSAWAPTGIMSSGGSVRALGVFGGQMVAGGWFNSVSHEGSARTIPRLARWDGQGWHTVDGGLAGHGGQTRVLELLSQGDRLYFSGEFTRVDGSNSSGVASLGPDGWAVYSVGVTPAGASLRAVAVHEEVLHVGGTAGVARLVGGAWEHLGGPPVYDLAVHEGDLYAAGSGGIRRRAGETWQWLGQSDGGTIRVNEAVFHDGQVFACGAFGSIGGIAAANVARWDGTQWHPLGSGVSGEATGLAFWNGDLIVCGAFTSAGGLAVDRIARWDGAQWHPFGGGFTNFGFFPPLQDRRVYRGQLFCAGSFRAINHQPGVEPAAGIARWDGAAWHALVEPPAQVSAPAFFSLAEHQGELVLGGNVVMIAGAPAYAWVRWTSGAPFIARHPVPLDAFESAAAEFSVAVTATGSVVPAYQWRRDGLALTDGPTPHGSILSGATSPTLVVANLAGDDAGEYDVVVTSPCGEATSAPAALAVRPAFCASDFDADGVIGTGDVSAFLAQWFADVAVGGLAADFDGSGAVATPDISAFLAAWFVALAGGC